MAAVKTPSADVRIGYLNAWAGCVDPGIGNCDHVVDFLVKAAHNHDILALSEVHVSGSPGSTPRFVCPRSPGHRLGPIDTELGNRLQARLEATHSFYYVAHFDNALHDFEASTIPLQYGNVLLIKKQMNVVLVEACTLHYNKELNSEQKLTNGTYIGRSAARKALIATFMVRNVPITLLTPHGLYSKQGKVDLASRFAQNGQMGVNIDSHLRRFQRNQEPHSIVMGDLNYAQPMMALENLLARKEIFGNTPGINMNAKYGIMDTRHPHWYPKSKPTREGNFLCVSSALLHYTNEFQVNYDTPSDHAMLTYSLSIKMPRT